MHEGEIQCEGKNTEIQREIKGTKAKGEIEKVKGGQKKYR